MESMKIWPDFGLEHAHQYLTVGWQCSSSSSLCRSSNPLEWLDHYSSSLNSRTKASWTNFHQSLSVSLHPMLSPPAFCSTFSHLSFSLSLQRLFRKYLTLLMLALNASSIRCSGLSGRSYFAKTRSGPDAVTGGGHQSQPCSCAHQSCSGGHTGHALVNQ